jgi:hypothetical protein
LSAEFELWARHVAGGQALLRGTPFRDALLALKKADGDAEKSSA